MLAIDHAIITVSDPVATAERFAEHAGLKAVHGGRHSGHGTGNLIVPLGDTYVELMTVVDQWEAERSPMGRWVLERSRHGDRLSALCLRTDAIDEVAARIGHAPTPMRRQRPDGTELQWRLAGLPAAISEERLPFFIQWDVADEAHPGRMPVQHAVSVAGIAWVEYGGEAGRMDRWLGDHDLPIRCVAEPSGPRRLAIVTGNGPVVIDATARI
jgi:hypothetical protein